MIHSGLPICTLWNSLCCEVEEHQPVSWTWTLLYFHPSQQWWVYEVLISCCKMFHPHRWPRNELFCDLFLHLDTPVNNDRYVSLQFEVKQATVLHGFAGYFDTVLYDEHTLSELLPVIPNYAHHSSFASCVAVPVQVVSSWLLRWHQFISDLLR